MSTRLNDQQAGAKVVVMQRIHQSDLTGHLLDKGGYEHLCLPAEFEGCSRATCLGWRDPRKEAGQPLWPERFGEASLAELKAALGSWAAAGQLQQRPAPAGGGVFKREWWRFFAEAPELDAKSRLVQSWDTGFKTGESNAYSVGQCWAENEEGCFLLDQVRDRMEYPELKRAVAAFHDKWSPEAVLIEDKASGQSLAQELARGARLPLVAIKVGRGDKEMRAHAVSPLVEAGRVWLPEASSWLSDFLEEATLFPNSAYADQVDAATQALSWLQGRKRRAKPRQTHY